VTGCHHKVPLLNFWQLWVQTKSSVLEVLWITFTWWVCVEMNVSLSNMESFIEAYLWQPIHVTRAWKQRERDWHERKAHHCKAVINISGWGSHSTLNTANVL
jgi:hypothetical protein